ncbi:hypothetical protein PS914_03442 [Pseudomonas fluorescens]|nr:hypothetical protein PS914_03442 [Pseudomonas fluorescens]
MQALACRIAAKASWQPTSFPADVHNNVGAGLPAKASFQAIHVSTGLTPSLASQLLQLIGVQLIGVHP